MSMESVKKVQWRVAKNWVTTAKRVMWASRNASTTQGNRSWVKATGIGGVAKMFAKKPVLQKAVVSKKKTGMALRDSEIKAMNKSGSVRPSSGKQTKTGTAYFKQK